MWCTGFSLQWPPLFRSTGSRWMGSSSWSAWTSSFQLLSSKAQAQQLRCTGLVAQRYASYSQTRDQTCVPCIGRQILIHCTTREVLSFTSFNLPPLHPHRPTTIGTNHYELQCLVNEVLVYKLYFLFVRKVVLNCYAIWSLIHILNNLSVFSISLDFVYILFSQHLKPFPA